jgi:hypothetical protein
MSPPSGLRNVLVLTSSERPVAELRELLGDDVGELRVVVPTVRQSRLQWLTNADDDARERAQDTASSIAEGLPAEAAEGSAGDPDPLLAAEDALREFDADEVVVVTRPDEEATWLEEGSSEAIAQALGGVKVSRLVVSDT